MCQKTSRCDRKTFLQLRHSVMRSMRGGRCLGNGRVRLSMLEELLRRIFGPCDFMMW